jgi:hypothetical protein
MRLKTCFQEKTRAYFGLLAGSIICLAILLAYTVLKLTTTSFDPAIDSSTFAVFAVLFAAAAETLPKANC